MISGNIPFTRKYPFHPPEICVKPKSRYIEIHQETFVSVTMAISLEMYLTLGYVSFFRIYI